MSLTDILGRSEKICNEISGARSCETIALSLLEVIAERRDISGNLTPLKGKLIINNEYYGDQEFRALIDQVAQRVLVLFPIED